MSAIGQGPANNGSHALAAYAVPGPDGERLVRLPVVVIESRVAQRVARWQDALRVEFIRRHPVSRRRLRRLHGYAHNSLAVRRSALIRRPAGLQTYISRLSQKWRGLHKVEKWRENSLSMLLRLKPQKR